MDKTQSHPLTKERLHTSHYGAHSGSRSGLADYHDGDRLSHYGGNDDVYSILLKEERTDFDEHIALGNDNEANDLDDENDHGKYHSGL